MEALFIGIITLIFLGSGDGFASEEAQKFSDPCLEGLESISDFSTLSTLSKTLIEELKNGIAPEEHLTDEFNTVIRRVWQQRSDPIPTLTSKDIENIRTNPEVQEAVKKHDGKTVKLVNFWYFPSDKPPGIKVEAWISGIQGKIFYGFPQLSLGMGGNKEVYFGIDSKSKNPLAIGRVSTTLGSEIAVQNKFAKESNIHPLESFVFHGPDFFNTFTVDKYYNKGTLDSHQEFFRAHPLESIRIARQLLTQLAQLDELQISHRDLKPSNIFLEKQENGCLQAAIADFGLAEPGNTGNGFSMGFIIKFLIGEKNQKTQMTNGINPPHPLTQIAQDLIQEKLTGKQALEALNKLSPPIDLPCISPPPVVISMRKKIHPLNASEPNLISGIHTSPPPALNNQLVTELNQALSKISLHDPLQSFPLLNAQDLNKIRANSEVGKILSGPPWTEGLKLVIFKHPIDSKIPPKMINVKAWISPQKEVFYSFPDWPVENEYKTTKFLGFSSRTHELLDIREEPSQDDSELTYQNLLATKSSSEIPALRHFHQPDWFPEWVHREKAHTLRDSKIPPPRESTFSQIDHLAVFPHYNLGTLEQNAKIFLESKTEGLSILRQLLAQLHNAHTSQVQLLESSFKFNEIALRDHKGCIQATFQDFLGSKKVSSSNRAEATDRENFKYGMEEFLNEHKSDWKLWIQEPHSPGSLGFVLNHLMKYSEDVYDQENGNYRWKNLQIKGLIDSIDNSEILSKSPCNRRPSLEKIPKANIKEEGKTSPASGIKKGDKNSPKNNLRKYKCCSARTINKTIACKAPYAQNRNPELVLVPNQAPLCKKQGLDIIWSTLEL